MIFFILFSLFSALAIREMSGLKQQLIKFYNNYVNSREVCQKLKQQYESVTGRLNKEITQLTDERNAAMTEYTLTMSERLKINCDIEKHNCNINFV